MRKHLKYLSYVLRHKWFVLYAGVRWTKAPLWRLLIHDWSKFLPSEWCPYAEKFYGGKKSPQDALEVDAAFEKAWLHHQHMNPHHWQHWVLREDSGATKVLTIPFPLVREMVADWLGAGRTITGKWEAAAWFDKNRSKMLLAEMTEYLVEVLLNRQRRHAC